MKRISCFFVLIALLSCTSNTIFEKPKNLIPKDTMSLLLQDLILASSAKFHENNHKQTSVNYIPLVYKKYKIDSTRFKISNDYYVTVVDTYKEILEDVQKNLETQEDYYNELLIERDSLREVFVQDSIDNIKYLKKIDSLSLDSLKKIIGKKIKTKLSKKDTLKMDSIKKFFLSREKSLDTIK